jgi:hypothetical protein
MSVSLTGHGISVELPDSWDGRITRSAESGATLHAGSYSLPPYDGGWAGAAVRALPSGGSFLALIEQDPAFAGRGAYAPDRLPVSLDLSVFGPGVMPNPRPGCWGFQFPCTVSGRSWVLWIVVDRTMGSDVDRISALAGLLASAVIERDDPDPPDVP